MNTLRTTQPVPKYDYLRVLPQSPNLERPMEELAMELTVYCNR